MGNTHRSGSFTADDWKEGRQWSIAVTTHLTCRSLANESRSLIKRLRDVTFVAQSA